MIGFRIFKRRGDPTGDESDCYDELDAVRATRWGMGVPGDGRVKANDSAKDDPWNSFDEAGIANVFSLGIEWRETFGFIKRPMEVLVSLKKMVNQIENDPNSTAPTQNAIARLKAEIGLS